MFMVYWASRSGSREAVLGPVGAAWKQGCKYACDTHSDLVWFQHGSQCEVMGD